MTVLLTQLLTVGCIVVLLSWVYNKLLHGGFCGQQNVLRTIVNPVQPKQTKALFMLNN